MDVSCLKSETIRVEPIHETSETSQIPITDEIRTEFVDANNKNRTTATTVVVNIIV